jgi:hypothetical protein
VLTVITQNVDDLHQRAGNTDAIRLHGDILEDRWLDACDERVACATTAARPGRPPQCARCGNRLRPAVVWFGEMLPPRAIDAAERAVGRCGVLLVVGTSGAVWPAAGLAATARRAGAYVAIVNPHASEIDDVAHALLRGTAAELLPRLLALPGREEGGAAAPDQAASRGATVSVRRSNSLTRSSWIKAVHSENSAKNPRVFLTIFDSTRKRGTNNMRCLYLQCTAAAVEDPAEARRAFALLYPDDPMTLDDFRGAGRKRFYRATPLHAWLNCLSERELTPATIKMRAEVPLALLRTAT